MTLPPFLPHALKFALGAGAITWLIQSGALNPHVILRAFLHNPLYCLAALLAYVLLVKSLPVCGGSCCCVSRASRSMQAGCSACT